MKPKVGLLGLYLKLYDDAMPEVRPRIDEFYSTIVSETERRGIEVVTQPVCRIAAEFDAAVSAFETEGVDAIITLHLAYSPSLESSEALAKTSLPVIVLDTSPAFSYAPDQDPAELMYNHGIHGVQDMCNLLIRNAKPFAIEAGHWAKSDVLDRVAGWARAAKTASAMRRARVGLVGTPFAGMGDFAVEPATLREVIGVEIVPMSFEELTRQMPAADSREVATEIDLDRARFEVVGEPGEAHTRSVRASLAVRKIVEREKLTGFTMNFGSFNPECGLPTVPFLEASKLISRGIGYGGEGDVLTAALVGALAQSFPDTTFTEMFCADWENDTVFISHMGEMNIDLTEGKAVLMEKPMPWMGVDSPVVALGRFRAGDAVFVNLAPGPDDSFTLILAPVEVLGASGEDRMTDTIRGWFRPCVSVADFLADYSRLGGTHHAAMVYGDVTDDLVRFGEMMGWNVAVLG